MEAGVHGQDAAGQPPTWVAELEEGGVSWDRARVTWTVDASSHLTLFGPDPNPYTVVLESRKQGEIGWIELGNFTKWAGDKTNQTPLPDPPAILLPERILAPPPADSTHGSSSTNVIGIGNLSEASYTHHRLEADTVYEYRMKAVNSYGETPYSGILAIRTAPLPPPPAPDGSFVRNLPNGFLQVLWTRSKYAQEFLVERRHLDFDWQEIAAVDGTEHSWIDDSTSPGLVHHYRVLARNHSGTSLPGPAATATTHRIRQLLHEPAGDELSSLWRERSGVILAAGPDDPERNALWFSGAGPRSLRTRPLVFLLGGFLEFDFWTNDSFNADSRILLQASLGGSLWTTLGQIDPGKHRGRWRTLSIELPDAWSSPGLEFRFLQTSHGGEGRETWAIRDFRVLAIEGTEQVPPVIRIHTPLAGTALHRRPSIRLTVTATDNRKLLRRAWSLNGGPWRTVRLPPDRKVSWFVVVSRLKRGQNLFRVRATDAAGNLSSTRKRIVTLR